MVIPAAQTVSPYVALGLGYALTVTTKLVVSDPERSSNDDDGGMNILEPCISIPPVVDILVSFLL